jgi:hypothetical protein
MELQLGRDANENEICATNSRFENTHGVSLGRNIKTQNDEEATRMLLAGTGLPAMLSTWVISLKLFESLNGFNENLPAAEDLDFAVRAVHAGAKFRIIRNDLSRYLIHSNSKSVLKRSAQRRMGTLIRENRGRLITNDQIFQIIQKRIEPMEARSLYADLALRKFMSSARISIWSRKYYLLLLSIALDPFRFISKVIKQAL